MLVSQGNYDNTL